MAPRKSTRLQAKGPKSKKIMERIELLDETTSSESERRTTTKDGNVREARSKELHDHSVTDKPSQKDKASLSTKKDNKRKAAESPEGSSEDDSEDTVSDREVTKLSEKKTKSLGRFSGKILECTFIDFKYFTLHGFYWEFWLNRIGCKNVCQVTEAVDKEIVLEFYANLEQMEDCSLKSKVLGKEFKITRKDLIDCFKMLDCESDQGLITMERNDVFREINDGIGSYKEKDIFSTDFELIIRLFHKAIVDCILPKNGSATTISLEEAIVILAMKKNLKLDMPTIMLNHLWRTRDNRPYGNLLIKLFKFKKLDFPKSQKPIGLKKFGEINVKKMRIMVVDKLWFSKDGAWYRHSKFNKFKFDWEKMRALAEGEEGADDRSEDEDEEAGKKGKSKKAGKKKVTGRKKKYEMRTGGNFEINEGRVVEDTESDSDSEIPFVRPPGETSQMGSNSDLLKLVEKRFADLKEDLTKSIIDMINSPKQSDHCEPTYKEVFPSGEELVPETEQRMNEEPDTSVQTFHSSSPPPDEALEALQLISVQPPVLPEPISSSPTFTIDESLAAQIRDHHIHTLQPRRTFPQRKKVKARKSVKPIEWKKDN